MHTCCAPCSVYCIDRLRSEQIEPTIYWFNPNIHPYMEYKQRRDCLKEYTKSIDIRAIFQEDYGLREFCKNTIKNLDTRCQEYCYPVRLDMTAQYAKQNGYDTITTTLLVSPYQKHEKIHELGDKIAEEYGLKFLYIDFREGFRQGQKKAREMGLYMQKYCGCIFSEQIANYDRIISEQKVRLLENAIIEKKIRLSWDVSNLELKPHKSGKQDEIQFIYNLKKEVYKEYVEKTYGEWNGENQQKLFARFMKENSKNIELIYLKDELVRIL